ncbi:alpha/beta fold hydrolase [Antrihabitans sp. YC3-6]|uniref:Alpha/beta fold hydrolase n=2 Tax=Antrihabitans stalagmiti TaxID=2799499 RepID=A0A934U4U3_9NOCA|nr:alpha/beta fold hydrolase [Antrihabitans stalagmiti]
MTVTERPTWVDDTLFPFESCFVELDGNVVHYVDEGSGPVLLMLHSNPVWSFVYRDVITALRTQFRCIALDFPGFGLSTGAPDYRHHADEHAELLVSFLDHLNLSEVTLIAHGWGGPLGLYAAEQRPGLFDRLILTNTWAWPLNGDLFSEVASRGMGNPVGRALMRQFNPLVNYFIPTAHKRRKVSAAEMVHYRNTTSTPEQRRASAIQPGDLVGARAFFVDLVDRLGPVAKLPTLIVWGDTDLIFTDKYRKRLERTFPNHSTTVLEGVGHYPMSDAPEEFAAAIRDWQTHSRRVDDSEIHDH